MWQFIRQFNFINIYKYLSLLSLHTSQVANQAGAYLVAGV